MEKDKVIFLDRDGVINIDKGYIYRIEDFELIEGVIDALKILMNNGFKIIIVTNQSGIARGYYTYEDFKNLTNYMIDYFLNLGVSIFDVIHCPHHINGIVEKYKIDCDCRKPKTGMFKKASLKHGLDIDYNNSYMIGDKESDVLAGENFGIKSYLVADDYKLIDIVEKIIEK